MLSEKQGFENEKTNQNAQFLQSVSIFFIYDKMEKF